MTKLNNDKNIIEGHEYDGIRELDNKLPPWWLYLFYITIIWAAGYLFYYHVSGIGDSSFEEYMKETDPQGTEARAAISFHIGYRSPFYSSVSDLTPMRRRRIKEELAEALAIKAAEKLAEEKVSVKDMSFNELIISALRVATPEERENLKKAFPEIFTEFQNQMSVSDKKEMTVTSEPEQKKVIEQLTDEASLSAGKSVYEINCATCHGKLGEGGIGPNLTDNYYLHGAGMLNTVHIIQQGVAAKGMIAWQGILNDDQIIQVTSYVLSLHGTNPPNAKAPQGEEISVATAE